MVRSHPVAGAGSVGDRPWRAAAVLVVLLATCGGSTTADAVPSVPGAVPTTAGATPQPVGVGTGPAPAPTPPADCPADPGTPIVGLPPTTLPCLAGPGRTVAVAAVHDRPEVINVWASWCDPCRREAPLLEAAHRAANGRVLFLGVNSHDERGAALRFVANSGSTYPHVFDESASFALSVGAVGMPYTLVVDASGRIVYRQIGVLTASALQAGLARAGVALTVPGG